MWVASQSPGDRQQVPSVFRSPQPPLGVPVKRPPCPGAREWRLRCGHCGAEWSTTSADVLAGDAWLACPACHDEAAQLVGGALGEALRRATELPAPPRCSLRGLA